jgi:hypothetical protein
VKLPNVERAEITEEKITGYLLSVTHRDGRHKAAFFMSYGFAAQNWEVLAKALRQHAAENKLAKTEQTPFGTRYVVEGPLQTPNGRTPLVRVVWFVERGQTVPRLATAYPLK